MQQMQNSIDVNTKTLQDQIFIQKETQTTLKSIATNLEKLHEEMKNVSQNLDKFFKERTTSEISGRNESLQKLSKNIRAIEKEIEDLSQF